MSAQEQMRALLDQLMGTARDGEPGAHRVRFDDREVCKSFLLNVCPHDILASTRMDLGECPKLHDNALRADFENAQKSKDYFYDLEALDHLESFVRDADHKVEMAKRKLKETQEELSEEAAAKMAVINNLGEQIGTKLAKAEGLGAQGAVEESMKLMGEVDELKKKKSEAEMDYHMSMPASAYQQQKLRVCEVCCAYLGIYDNDQRLADHFGGKLHLGFITIRDNLNDLRVRAEERKMEREHQREARRRERSDSATRSRNRPRSRSGSKSKRKERSRSRSRERKRRSRSPRHSKSRSSNSGSNKRSRSRDKDKKSSSGASSSRRSRSRSGDRKRGSGRAGSPSRSSKSSSDSRKFGREENGGRQ